MKPTNLAKYLTTYLSSYLPGTLGLSTNTIASRRDTFIILFEFLEKKRQIDPSKADIPILSVSFLTDFLDWIENERHCDVSTRNLRLSGLKAFFKYLHAQTPDYAFQCQQIFNMPLKRKPEKGFDYLTVEGVKAVIGCIPTKTPMQRRDVVLLSVMYDSAARVQEIADLRVHDIRLSKPATLRLTGKGKKTRIIPLMEPTAKLIQQYLTEFHLEEPNKQSSVVFTNREGKKLTRAGITYILKKYVELAKMQNDVSLFPAKISPHSFRHSKSMHMLQSGVNLIYIRDFLGHSMISTTEIYARCDSKEKRKAIESAYTNSTPSGLPAWQEDAGLMAWLKSLC
jgi:site-specific recombinase XerD